MRADSPTPRVVDTTIEYLPVHSQAQDVSTTKPASTKSITSLSPVERLWFQAYNNLRVEDATLVRDFEALSSVLGTASLSESKIINDHDPMVYREHLRQLIRVGLEKTATEARIKNGIGDVLGIILKAKDMVDSAIQAVPHAALAWSGVCLTLEVYV